MSSKHAERFAPQSSADAQIAWAAGLFEGEGCITIDKTRGYRYIRLYLGSTDEDIVRRFHRIAGCGNTNGPYTRAGCKPHWQWRAVGESAERFLDEVLPHLGERRQARAAEARQIIAEARA